MKTQVQENMYEEKGNEEGAREKKPYHTPTLTKLGNLEELTKGVPPQIVSDELGASF